MSEIEQTLEALRESLEEHREEDRKALAELGEHVRELREALMGELSASGDGGILERVRRFDRASKFASWLSATAFGAAVAAWIAQLIRK